MSFLKKLFQGKTNEPVEPIFPGERFSIIKLNFEDGWGLATINNLYNDYPNKSFFPWHVLVELEFTDKNENGHPANSESEKLIALEEKVLHFLQEKHTVHFIGRVTRNGARDLLYYIDKPRIEQAELSAFCDEIMKERNINFGIHKDPKWTAVGGFIN
jgi:Family of unknown function (DUF695).